MRYLTFALAKGRLANKTMDMFEKLGITCDSIRDKETRKLIFVNEDLKLKFFLAKASDVPTYVEYGAADIGIVGEDTILEEGRNLYEVMDLGFGKCKMCVCGPESAREKLQHGGVKRGRGKPRRRAPRALCARRSLYPLGGGEHERVCKSVLRVSGMETHTSVYSQARRGAMRPLWRARRYRASQDRAHAEEHRRPGNRARRG